MAGADQRSSSHMRASRGIRRPGSILAHKVNFVQDERAFEKSDIPERALAAKKHVIASKIPDIVGVSRPPWNSSCPAVEPYPKHQMQRTLSEVL